MPSVTAVDKLMIRLSSIGNLSVGTPIPERFDEDFTNEDLKISFNVKVLIDRPGSDVVVNVSLNYYLRDRIFYSASLDVTYDVVNLASLISSQEGSGEFRVENDFLPTLIGTAFSSTRGYISRELKGTVLESYPFPMIDLDNIRNKVSYHLI